MYGVTARRSGVPTEVGTCPGALFRKKTKKQVVSTHWALWKSKPSAVACATATQNIDDDYWWPVERLSMDRPRMRVVRRLKMKRASTG